MRFLSSRRRHRAARPLLLLVALVAVGAFYALVTPSSTSADTEMTQQIEQGKAIFDTSCSSCHGLNGEGTSQGPSLIGVGGASVDFQMGTGRMPANRPEVQVPSGTVDYSQEQIDSVAAYIQSLGAGPEVPEEQQYSPEGLTDEELARGGSLFRANCSACHGVTGGGGALPHGKYAPSLENTSPVHKWEAIRTGPQQMPSFSQEVLTDQDVREIIGYLGAVNAQSSYGGLEMGGEGPVSEGLWAFIIGIGGLAIIAGWIARKGARAR